jgi:glycosyltransferase involved in cell wall biosynthesis
MTSKNYAVITPITPSKYHAGGQRTLDVYKIIRSLDKDCRITLLVINSHTNSRYPDHDYLYEVFDQVFFLDKSFEKSISEYNLNRMMFDVIDLQYSYSGKHISDCRKIWPSSTVILTVMDSSIRTMTSFMKTNFSRLFYPWKFFIACILDAVKEVIYLQLPDKVISISDADTSTINSYIFRKKVRSIKLLTCIHSKNENYELIEHEKNTIVYFAYFKSRSNLQALLWFISEVHPQILKKIPGYKFKVVGYGIDEKLKMKLSKIQGISIFGKVNNNFDALNKSAVGITPALSGAGMRGKIHIYALAGLPSVTSQLAVEGLKYKHEDSILVASNSLEFYQACVKLLTDTKLATKLASNAKKTCLNEYAWDSKINIVKDIYEVQKI